jgi:hypothetical protein
MFALCLLYACGGKPESADNKETPGTTQEKPAESKPDTYDPKRGEGKWTAENLQLGALNPQMAAEGQKVQALKCASCHKLNDERLVGPGWKGVTSRRKPEWIMNFITNPDPMITKDPVLQAQLEICLVRMPNQNLTDDEARAVLEFMRQNDGVQ